MSVTKQSDEQQIEPVENEVVVSPVADEPPVPEAEQQPQAEIVSPAPEPETLPPAPFGLHRSWLRFAYICEFWIAMISIFVIWSEVGGQGHLDLMPWYTKLGCSIALAWCIVRMSSASVEHARAWNKSTWLWFVAILLIASLMTGITYWYHLHEVPDQIDSDENTANSMVVLRVSQGL
ncbi:MAG TPA: hypothetical protein VKU01_35940 [Bryobacteraceae bacterium]|nr:hypothetical protein [Bryobacteraceae bacterium]